jgi:copper chaperone CopZ
MIYSFQFSLIGLLILSGLAASVSGISANNSTFNFGDTSYNDTTLVKFYLEGMCCQRCVQKIEKKVKAIKGVRKVNVFLEEKYALIVFERETTTIKAIIAEIEHAGHVVNKHVIIKPKKE